MSLLSSNILNVITFGLYDKKIKKIDLTFLDKHLPPLDIFNSTQHELEKIAQGFNLNQDWGLRLAMLGVKIQPPVQSHKSLKFKSPFKD